MSTEIAEDISLAYSKLWDWMKSMVKWVKRENRGKKWEQGSWKISSKDIKGEVVNDPVKKQPVVTGITRRKARRYSCILEAKWRKSIRETSTLTTLMAQWLRICLAMQGMWVWPLIGETGSHMLWGSQHATTKGPTKRSEDLACRSYNLVQPNKYIL